MLIRHTEVPQSYSPAPVVNPSFWSFSIRGDVQHPLIVSYADLQNYPFVELSVLITHGTSKPPYSIKTGRWSGVLLSNLLSDMTIRDDVQFAHIQSANGYTTVLPFHILNTALLATHYNGETLTHSQGAPARLIVPRTASFKMPKWVQTIELTSQPKAGFWEMRGASLEGRVEPFITVEPLVSQTRNKPVQISGTAVDFDSRIHQVEINIDSQGWVPAQIHHDDYGQTLWTIDWVPQFSGTYSVDYRALDVHRQRIATAHHPLLLQIKDS